MSGEGTSTFDWQTATKNWACVIEKGATENTSHVTEFKTEGLFRAGKGQGRNLFREEILSQLLLRPNKDLRDEIDAFEKKHNLTNGYNTIHLRWFNSCPSAVQDNFIAKQPHSVTMDDGEKVTGTDLCTMSSRYIRYATKRANTSHLPYFLMTDGQNEERIAEIKKEFNAVTYSAKKPQINESASTFNPQWVDTLLGIRAQSFLGNPESSFSSNIFLIRRFNAPCCGEDVMFGGAGTFPY